MERVFISYRHVQPDEDLANGIGAFLESQRFQVFIDRKLLTGQEWIAEIDRQLRVAHYFVVLLSPESIRSDMVRWEIEAAHNLRKEGRLRILPVRIRYRGPLPMDLGAYLNPIQYSIWNDDVPIENLCRQLLDGIRASTQTLGHEDEQTTREDLELMVHVACEQGAPLPSADPRLETGAVKLDSPHYIRRAADQNIEDMVSQEGITALIKGPRQVGKTSLVARGLARAQEQNVRVFYMDFQLTDSSKFASLDTLLRYLAAKIAREFNTDIKPAAVWDDMLGATDSLTEFIEQAVLSKAGTAVLFAFDEVDSLFSYEYRNGFFAMMRAWHNRRAMQPIWNRLNLVFGHSTEPALFIDDLNQSPFNVGQIIRLSDFSRDEVERLNMINGQPLRRESEISGLLDLLGGQPYLCRQAFYCLRTTVKSLAELRRIAIEEDGPFGDHLRRLLWNLQQRGRMAAAFDSVLREKGCESETDFQRLRAAGLVSGESRNEARVRCDLYRLYFQRHL